MDSWVNFKSFLSWPASLTLWSALDTRSCLSIKCLTSSSYYDIACMFLTRSPFNKAKFYKCLLHASKSSSSWLLIFSNEIFSSFKTSNSRWPSLTWFILTFRIFSASLMFLPISLFFITSAWVDFFAKSESFLNLSEEAVASAIFLCRSLI